METNSLTQDGTSAPFPVSDVLLWGALPQLQLNIAQTAALCGISVRQLGYWTKQGYVTASGRGARRMYGLDALRRVLAVRNAMTNGASLRQALKAQPEASDALVVPPAFRAPEAFAQSVPEDAPRPQPPLPPQEAEALAADLAALFAANRQTRDDALGLAVKVGRSPADTRRAAEALCVQGVLTQTISLDNPVFQSAGKEGV